MSSFRSIRITLLTVLLATLGSVEAPQVDAAREASILGVTAVGNAPAAIAVDARTGRTFVVNSGDTSVTMLDARSGKALRTIRLNKTAAKEDNSYAPAVDESSGRVFVVIQRHPPAASSVAVLDAVTGNLLRTTVVGSFASAAAVDERTGRVFVTNLDSNTVGVLDSHTGVLLRTVAVGRGPGGISVDVAQGRVFVGNSDGTVSVLDARSGAVVRSVSTGQPGNGFAAIVAGPGGRVFAFNQNGRMSVLESPSGSLLRTSQLGMFPGGIGIFAPRGRVVITNPGMNGGGHAVGILNAASGAMVRTVTVGAGPLGIAVDASTARIFVANYTGNSVSVIDARRMVVLRTVKTVAPFAIAVDARTHHVFVAGFSTASVTTLDSQT